MEELGFLRTLWSTHWAHLQKRPVSVHNLKGDAEILTPQIPDFLYNHTSEKAQKGQVPWQQHSWEKCFSLKCFHSFCSFAKLHPSSYPISLPVGLIFSYQTANPPLAWRPFVFTSSLAEVSMCLPISTLACSVSWLGIRIWWHEQVCHCHCASWEVSVLLN